MNGYNTNAVEESTFAIVSRKPLDMISCDVILPFRIIWLTQEISILPPNGKIIREYNMIMKSYKFIDEEIKPPEITVIM